MRIESVQRYIWLFVGLLAVYGLYRVIAQAWVCDDAFISFRYAKNLIEGHGLVFNAGEKVEGYTNFLWTLLVAAGMLAGAEPILFTQVFGILAYGVTVMVFLFLALRISGASGGSRALIIPITALVLLVHRDFQIYATSGMETSLVTALVSLGFSILVLRESKTSRGLAGMVLILATLTRPDAMIFYLMAIPYLLLQDKNRRAAILYYLVPLGVVYIPYWVIRCLYYGHLCPNSYYAKSIALPYYSQGIHYLWLYLKTYYILLLSLPAVIFVLPQLVKRIWRQRQLTRQADRALLLGLLFVVPYVFFIVRIGGDFMFARFFIPVTPIAVFLLELAIVILIKRNILRIALVALLLAGVFFRWHQFHPETAAIRGIVDEPRYYPRAVVKQAEIDGQRLKHYFSGLDVTVGFVGTKAMLVYYAEVPTAIECHTGLTDEYIAHLPVAERGRPGHEKNAPIEYLLRRQVNFLFDLSQNKVSPDQPGAILFNELPAIIIGFENRVMEKLKAYPDIQFVDFPGLLDRYIEQMGSMPESRRRQDFEFFKRYYFNYNQDPARLAAFADMGT